MFRKSKADEIGKFFALQVKKNELAVFYLGVSGFIARSSSQTVLLDPAGMLKDDEIKALKAVNLLLFTHNHLDHFSSGKTEAIFKATAAPIVAEPKWLTNSREKYQLTNSWAFSQAKPIPLVM